MGIPHNAQNHQKKVAVTVKRQELPGLPLAKFRLPQDAPLNLAAPAHVMKGLEELRQLTQRSLDPLRGEREFARLISDRNGTATTERKITPGDWPSNPTGSPEKLKAQGFKPAEHEGFVAIWNDSEHIIPKYDAKGNPELFAGWLLGDSSIKILGTAHSHPDSGSNMFSPEDMTAYLSHYPEYIHFLVGPKKIYLLVLTSKSGISGIDTKKLFAKVTAHINELERKHVPVPDAEEQAREEMASQLNEVIYVYEPRGKQFHRVVPGQSSPKRKQ